MTRTEIKKNAAAVIDDLLGQGFSREQVRRVFTEATRQLGSLKEAKNALTTHTQELDA